MEDCSVTHQNRDRLSPNQSKRVDVHQGSNELYHYNVNNDTDFMFNFKREFYVAVRQNENLTKSDLIKFTLNINGDTVTSIVSRNNCVINCTSNGYCVYNIPDITTDAVEDGPAIVDVEFDGIDHCASGILVTDSVIETSLDPHINDLTPINDITVIIDTDEYQCSRVIPNYCGNVTRYHLLSDKIGKSEKNLTKWIENHNQGTTSSNGNVIRNYHTRKMKSVDCHRRNDDIKSKKARTSSPLTDLIGQAVPLTNPVYHTGDH